MREDLVLILYPSCCHSIDFMTLSKLSSFVIGVSPFTLQVHHTLHCIHGSQMNMPLETLLGPG